MCVYDFDDERRVVLLLCGVVVVGRMSRLRDDDNRLLCLLDEDEEEVLCCCCCCCWWEEEPLGGGGVTFVVAEDTTPFRPRLIILRWLFRMGCDLDRWAVDWSRFGGDGRWLLPLLCCNLLLWQPFASSNCNSDNDSLRRDADFDLRWLFAKFGLITLLVGVAVGDSTILRRLFDQEIVILLSYCEQG